MGKGLVVSSATTNTAVAISPPAPPASVSAHDGLASERYLSTPDNLTHTFIYVDVTLPGGSDAQWVTLWITSYDGSGWDWVGKFAVGASARFDRIVPAAGANWRVKATTGKASADNDPNSAVLSAPFAVAGLSSVPDAGATSITNATATYSVDLAKCGWAFYPAVNWTNPTDVNFFTTRLTVQLYNAAGVTAGWAEGAERPVEERAGSGAQEWKDPVGWTLPKASEAPTGFRYFRLRLYALTRAGQSTLCKCWPGAADHYDLHVTESQTVDPNTIPDPADVVLGTPQARFSAPDADGKVRALITIPFTVPNQPGIWDHVMAYLSAPDDVPTTSKAAVGADGDVGFFVGAAGTASNIVPNDNPVPFGPFRAAEPTISISYPMPEAAQVWRVRAPSGSTTKENTLASAPTVTVTVDPADALGPSGAEYAPNGANFIVNRTIQTTDGGNKTWGFDDSWTNPTEDPRYPQLGGYDVVIEYPDGRRETQDSPAKNRTTGSATGWTISTTDQTYKVWLVSWDVNGRRNSIVAGVTPCVSITIGPQVGAVGQEYAALVSGLTAVVSYSKSVDGVEQWSVATTWTNPTGDAAFAGGKIVLRPNSGADQALGYVGKADTQAVWGPYNIGAPITYTPYFVSMDNNGRENTLVVGTTPTAAAFEVKAQTTGGINAGRLDPTTLNPTLAIIGNKLGVPDGALSIASFASTIRPPLLLANNPALPGALYPAGTLLYNTTEHKLYRVNAAGNAWQAAVGTADLVAYCVTAGQIASGAVGTQQLYAGEILVGGGGGKPGRFKVVAADGSTAVAWIGDDGAGHQGIYAKNLWVGPTINTPQFYCDSNGNATFAGVLSVTGAGFTVNVDSANAFKITESGSNNYLQINNAAVTFQGGSAMIDRSGYYGSSFRAQKGNALVSGGIDQNGVAVLVVRDSNGADKVVLSSTEGLVINGTQCIGPLWRDAYFTSVSIGGNQVLAGRQAAVSAPTGGTTVDAEARTAVNAIISRLKTHGLIS